MHGTGRVNNNDGLTVLQGVETAMACVAVGAAGLPSLAAILNSASTPRGSQSISDNPPKGHPQHHLFISCESARKLGSKIRKDFQLLLDNEICVVNFYNSSHHNARSRAAVQNVFQPVASGSRSLGSILFEIPNDCALLALSRASYRHSRTLTERKLG